MRCAGESIKQDADSFIEKKRASQRPKMAELIRKSKKRREVGKLGRGNLRKKGPPSYET